MKKIEEVSIELKPGVYSRFNDFTNKPWYALGEYVDNAVQSYINYKDQLLTIAPNYKLIVKINIDWETEQMFIEDNAAGVDAENFQRAFEPANVHSNNEGLNEFGMGMKIASLWFANKWKFCSKALGEDVERRVDFDLNKVVAENKTTLKVSSVPRVKEEHYTKIELTDFSKNAPRVMQMPKIKKHLASIYRKFIRENELEIWINDEQLEYKDPPILNAPYYKTPDGGSLYWKKEINYQYGKYKAVGFIGILETMSTNEHNGFSLFRRGRVVLGSHDEKYRPKVLSGQPGSPRDKRIFGELELDGFNVSFNKSSFQDEGDLIELMELLKDELTNPEFDLYGQAEGYRLKSKEGTKKIAKQITSNLKKETQPRELTKRIEESVRNVQNIQEKDMNMRIVQKADTLATHEVPFIFKEQHFIFKVEFINEPTLSDLYSLIIRKDQLFEGQQIECKINLAHSFFIKYDKIKDYEPIVSIIKSLALAEIIAPSQDTKNAGNVRLLFNQFIQDL